MLLAFAFSYLGMLLLSLAMSRHHKRVFQREPAPARRRLLRSLAPLAFALALAVCWWQLGGEMGAVLWACLSMLAGMLVGLLLAWRERWVLPGLAALLLGGLVAACF